MCSNIKSIKNFTTTVEIDNTATWYAQNTSFQHTADVCIIRSITYASNLNDKDIVNINCNFSPDVIGSVFRTTEGFVTNPQREIKLNTPNLSQIRFWISGPTFLSAQGDVISIEMDFITYHK